MEIILTQDITGVGYKNDLLTVKDGYGRNYLIPKKMAVIATESNKKQLAELKKQQSFKQEKIRKEAEALAKALEGSALKIVVKASTTGKIFGSVNSIIVANAIKEQRKVEIDRKKINLDEEHIKEVGTFKAVVKLHKDVEVEIELDVVAD
ncbi:MAG: 50S ribosomal protein L9 [Bacteroidales bacterium]|nr:50S ribosomal protein L9 [Bacteroidales bacterium]MCF6341540.1 50S ribosomal protein L9 [Bacteroidales bacterium]